MVTCLFRSQSLWSGERDVLLGLVWATRVRPGAREGDSSYMEHMSENGLSKREWVLLPGVGWRELLQHSSNIFSAVFVQSSIWERATKMNTAQSFPAKEFMLQWRVTGV